MKKVATVYLFSRIECGRKIAPKQMWGTLEAIAGLPGRSTPLLESAREVPEDSLEYGGFTFSGSWSLRATEDEPALGFDGPGRRTLSNDDVHT